MSTLAQLQREMIAEATEETLAHKAKRGDVYGRIPFGYDGTDHGPNGRPRRMVENPAEQRALREMREAYKNGMSLRRIAARLNLSGIRPKHSRAGRWDHASVRYIVESPRLVEAVQAGTPDAHLSVGEREALNHLSTEKH